MNRLVLETLRLLLVCQQSDRTAALADLIDGQIAEIDRFLTAWLPGEDRPEDAPGG